MLHVYDGVLRFYSGAAVERHIYDRWFRLNVVHDVAVSTVAVLVDGDERFRSPHPRHPHSRSYYFKFGVYMQHQDQSARMDESDGPTSHALHQALARRISICIYMHSYTPGRLYMYYHERELNKDGLFACIYIYIC
jgi:hypothetical protein